MKVIAKKDNIKSLLKTVIASALLCAIALGCAACGGKNFEGVYTRRASNGNTVVLTISNGSVLYEAGTRKYAGRYVEQNGKLYMDFDGNISQNSEPLIATMSSDSNTLTVSSARDDWSDDVYQRADTEAK